MIIPYQTGFQAGKQDGLIDKVLAIAPDYVPALANKGNALGNFP
jgi:hypothetical protein